MNDYDLNNIEWTADELRAVKRDLKAAVKAEDWTLAAYLASALDERY